MKIIFLLITLLSSLSDKAEDAVVILPSCTQKYFTIRLLNIDSSNKVEEEKFPIKFEVKNISSVPIYISDPQYWVNLKTLIFKDNKLLSPTVRADLSNREIKVLLLPRQVYQVEYSYPLEKIYSFLNKEKGEYHLKVKFVGNLYNENKKIIAKNYEVSSDIIKFKS